MLMHAILHATVAGIIGFFVLFAASKAEGIVKFVGTILGWWLWIIAVLSIVCVFVCPMMGGKMGDHWGMHGDWMHGGMMQGGMMHGSQSAPAPAATTAAPAKPAPAPAAPAAAPPKKP
jgi:hypothetical protein